MTKQNAGRYLPAFCFVKNFANYANSFLTSKKMLVKINNCHCGLAKYKPIKLGDNMVDVSHLI
jgi:hypothetical protein